jgi:hypothetical protein
MFLGKMKSAMGSFELLPLNGGAIRNMPRIFLGNLFSDKYLARNMPPKEPPMRITSLFICGINFLNQISHSRYLAFNEFGIRGDMTSKAGPNCF